MRDELRPEFGRAPVYPLAMLEIDPDVLEAKWALTHPPLALEAGLALASSVRMPYAGGTHAPRATAREPTGIRSEPQMVLKPRR